MNPPWMWWARDPGHGLGHAVATLDVEAAAERGWTEALCGHRLPGDVALVSVAELPVCLPCYVGVADDLRHPIPGEGEVSDDGATPEE